MLIVLCSRRPPSIHTFSGLQGSSIPANFYPMVTGAKMSDGRRTFSVSCAEIDA
jgi:hypothetical protein